MPTEAEWLPVYLQELTTFPSCKYDDQSDSTSQLLDWLKRNTQTYGVIEYIKQLEPRSRLHLPDDHQFVQWEEDEPITAIQDGTGDTIVWTENGWMGFRIERDEDKS